MNKVEKFLEEKLFGLKKTMISENTEAFNKEVTELFSWLDMLPPNEKEMLMPIAIKEVKNMVSWLREKLDLLEDIRIDQANKNNANHVYNQY